MSSFDTDDVVLRDLLDTQTASSVERMPLTIGRSELPAAPAEKKIPAQVARQMRPQWSGKSCATATENGSYLSQLNYRGDPTLNEQVFDSSMVRPFRTEYENMVTAQEYRAHYGLAENTEEQSNFQAMKDLARRAMNAISKIHFKAEGDRLKAFAQGQDGLREPVAAAILAASLYTGRVMKMKVTEGIRVESRAAIKDKAASVSMILPATGLSSTVAYSHDDQMSAQIAKSITNSVSAVVGSSASQKGSASVVYSVSF